MNDCMNEWMNQPSSSNTSYHRDSRQLSRSLPRDHHYSLEEIHHAASYKSGYYKQALKHFERLRWYWYHINEVIWISILMINVNGSFSREAVQLVGIISQRMQARLKRVLYSGTFCTLGLFQQTGSVSCWHPSCLCPLLAQLLLWQHED